MNHLDLLSKVTRQCSMQDIATQSDLKHWCAVQYIIHMPIVICECIHQGRLCVLFSSKQQHDDDDEGHDDDDDDDAGGPRPRGWAVRGRSPEALDVASRVW